MVYGDIGTSPLYALRECFSPTHGVSPSPGNVLGVVSLIFWSLSLIVSIKYLSLVMRANNKGEGGVFALISIVSSDRAPASRRLVNVLLMLGLFGGALLYGDGMITPAVTVLSAIEGLEVAMPAIHSYIVPLAVLVLLGLFSLQRFGTGRVGIIYGPVMLLWFLSLSLLGLGGIWQSPRILQALSPHFAAIFFWQNGPLAFVVLGSVFLAVTGAESLYADMGHFGLRPIRRAWFFLVFPALVLNYMGEGALLLVNPGASTNPFFLLAPSWAVLPMVALATLAAIAASQALISGVYSLTMQAIQMGYLPRMSIRHTSHATRGQIYMPQVNGFLMIACIGLVIGFRSSSQLAGAYGIAVSLTMLITSVLFVFAARRLWKWTLLQCAGLGGLFILLELAFVSANSLKILQGGWFPLIIASFIFILMITWQWGRQILRVRLSESYLPIDVFLRDLDHSGIHRVPGTAVFLSGNPTGTPIALLHNLRHNKVLHERVIIVTVSTKDIPYLDRSERLKIEPLRPNIYRLTANYGFMEQPDLPALLESCAEHDLKIEPFSSTFFLSRETIIPRTGSGLARWRRKLFAAMSRNAQSATAFFRLPPSRVVELGMQIVM